MCICLYTLKCVCYCAWVYVWLNLCSAHTVGARGVRGVATIFRSANNERLELSNSTDGSDRPMFPKTYIFNESVRRFILQPTVKGEQISKDKLLFWSSFRELNKGRWMRNAVRRMLLLSLSLSLSKHQISTTRKRGGLGSVVSEQHAWCWYCLR